MRFDIASWVAPTSAAGLALFVTLGTMLGVADAAASQNGMIAYTLIGLHWATYQTQDGKQECPRGLNEGPREQFKALFPDDGTRRALVDTQLRREIDGWFPTTAADLFKFEEASGPTALGMNLDGQIGPNDFTGPDGERGIDNQLYRALGCIRSYRGGPNDYFDNDEITKEQYDRWLIILTGVDSLVDDDEVEVTLCRGLDPVLTDATGNNFMPGGTQRVDLRWGARFIKRLRGKIRGGVLVTEPTDIAFPWSTFYVPADEYIRGARLQLKLSPTTADGMIGGYADVETWYLQTMKSESTHHQSYGQLSPPSLYKAFRQLADAYPDPKTGANTAISAALLAKFIQVYILPSSQAQLAAFVPRYTAKPYGGTPYPRTSEEETLEGHAVVSVAAAADTKTP
jgi:hypothetical protein